MYYNVAAYSLIQGSPVHHGIMDSAVLADLGYPKIVPLPM